MDPIVAKLAAALVCAVLTGLLAKRKNRNPWVWGVAGAFSLLIALLVLAFMPYKCPSCGESLTTSQVQDKQCPSCGNFTKTEQITREAPPVVHSPKREAEAADEGMWAAALAELESPERRSGLWAKAFAEASGSESAAKAAYLKVRVEEMRAAPPSFIADLRDKGYTVAVSESRWQVTDPGGGITRTFSTLQALEEEVPFLLDRVASS